MKNRKVRMPSPAMIVAVIALVVALTGASYAAVKLGKGTVTSKALKKNAVTTKKIKNEAVTEDKIATAARGRAIAYAEVNADGTVGTNSRGIANANVTKTGSGTTTVYCLHGLPKHGTLSATPGFGATEFDGIVSVNVDQAPLNADANLCSSVPGTQIAVLTYYDDFFGTIAPARASMPFFISLFQ